MTRKYTPADREYLVTAFEAALKYLAKNFSSTSYSNKKLTICGCMVSAANAGEISEYTKSMATNLIMDRLGEHCYYQHWVVDKVSLRAVNNDAMNNDSRKIQDGRRRWLKSLIKEFSS